MALKWPRWTAFVALDLDFVQFSADDYAHSFALGVALNASAIFAKSVFKNFRGHTGVYDQTALTFDTRWLKRSVQRASRCRYRDPGMCNGMEAMKRGCLVPVRSAFGGFGTYFSGALRQLPMAYTRGGANEHHALNEAIASLRSEPHLYVDPSFSPEYGWGGDEYWTSFCSQVRERRSRVKHASAAVAGADADDFWARRIAQQVHDHCLRRWPPGTVNASWVHPSWRRQPRLTRLSRSPAPRG